MATRLNSLLPLMTVICVMSTTPARTATFDVNDSRDAADAAPGDGACEATIGAADCTARAAVQEANAHPGADTIHFPAGVFAIGIPGESEDDAATGDFDITDSVTIHGTGRDQTILDGSGLDRILDVPRSAQHVVVVVVIAGLTLRGGSHGGMRFLADGSLDVIDCAVIDNHAPAAGGGLYAAGGDVSLVRSIVSGNHALMQGGGIRIHRGTLAVQDSEVSGNTVSGPRPAGIDATMSTVSIARGFVQDDLHHAAPERLVVTAYRH